MIRKYVKKPIEIEAIEYTGENIDEIREFSPGKIISFNHGYAIRTLEGEMHFKKGDFIIKGIKGEFYPCREDIFKETYEEAEARLEAAKKEAER